MHQSSTVTIIWFRTSEKRPRRDRPSGTCRAAPVPRVALRHAPPGSPPSWITHRHIRLQNHGSPSSRLIVGRPTHCGAQDFLFWERTQPLKIQWISMWTCEDAGRLWDNTLHANQSDLGNNNVHSNDAPDEFPVCFELVAECCWICQGIYSRNDELFSLLICRVAILIIHNWDRMWIMEIVELTADEKLRPLEQSLKM